MSPSLRMLADGPDVGAVVVITDGAIEFPDEEMPYSVLWALTEPSYADSFEPGYGRVIVLPPARDCLALASRRGIVSLSATAAGRPAEWERGGLSGG
jgi:hypothetical protein